MLIAHQHYHPILTFKSYKGLAEYGKDKIPLYANRMAYELEVIQKTKFSPYFLIVADLTAFMRRMGIRYFVRGSGCGSLCVWVTKISHPLLDPVAMEIPFERFLNPSRVSNPDIDIDIQKDRREEVVAYTVQKYGADRVARICNFGTFGAKAAIKDTFRVMVPGSGEKGGLSEAITAQMSNKPDATLKSELASNEALQEYQRRYPKEFKMASRIEGRARQPGKHAAGTVIAPDDIWKFVPTFFRGIPDDRENEDCFPTTQWDMYGVEKIGLLKMDYLGLNTLTVIDRCVAAITLWRQSQGLPAFSIDTVPTDDQATWDLISEGKLAGIFQVENRQTISFAKRMNLNKTRTLWGLAVLISIIRPGMKDTGMTEVYLRRAEGLEAPVPPHPLLERALKRSLGVFCFQEEVMLGAQHMAGMSLSEADELRAAMSKKRIDKMNAMKPMFISGSIKNGATKEEAEHVWEQIYAFSRYGFCLGHAAAYAIVGYFTAYLKTHFPAIFMACLINSESGGSSKEFGYNFKVAEYVEDARKMGLKIIKPCMKRSTIECAVNIQKGEINFGLSLIKSVSFNAAKWIVEKASGARNVLEFAVACFDVVATGRKVSKVVEGVKTDTPYDEYKSQAQVNSREIEALIWSGSLDYLISNEPAQRPYLAALMPIMLDRADKFHAVRAAIMSGKKVNRLSHDKVARMNELVEVNWDQMSLEQILTLEREYTGCYLTYSPFHPFMDRIGDCATWSDMQFESDYDSMWVAVLIKSFREHVTKKGQKMCYLSASMVGSDFDITVFPNLWESLSSPNSQCKIEHNKVYKVKIRRDRQRENVFVLDQIIRMSE